MDKNVLIHVKGIQLADQKDEEAPIELVVPGEYYFRNGSHFLKYEEMVEDYSGSTVSYVKISEKSVEVRKKGLINVHMVFEPGKKNLTYYATPFGTVQMGIAATHIHVDQEEKALTVNVEYALDMSEGVVAECYLTIHADEKNSASFQL